MAFIFQVPGIGHFVVEGTPGDPLSAKLVAASPAAVAEELKWRDLPIILPSVPRVPEGPPCPVELVEGCDVALIHGEAVPAPKGSACRALRLLLRAYPGGVSGQELNAMSGATNACSALVNMAMEDRRWGRVLLFPLFGRGAGEKGRQYGIRVPALKPSGGQQ